MQKISCFFFLLLIISCTATDKNSEVEIIELPIIQEEGFGDFYKRYGIITTDSRPKSIWSKTEVETKGISENWKDPVVKQIWFDAHQFVYQNFIAGNIDTARFEELKKSWNFDPEKGPYSKEPIKSFTHLVFFKNPEGKLFYKIDTNNNRDFSDEEIFSTANESNLVGSSGSVIHTLKYQAIRNDEVTDLETSFEIKPHTMGLMNNHPVHFSTELDGSSIQISNGFQSTDFNSVTNLLVGQQDSTSSPNPIQINEYLTVNNTIYQNLGVNANKMVLTLKKLPKDTMLYSTQVGFLAKNFTGKEFTTNESINLDNYRGKFVYLDFWGSWCAPCIDEMPYHVDAYQKLDSSKIEFIGIAANDNEKRLRETLDKFKVKWPQIFSNDIPKDYRIVGYPTSFLIDPEGIIVAKNLRGAHLSDTLDHYLKNSF
tara:strand:+ start:67423 stop:68703 length:1281 start_codon:yes stop_codon:yes gene_type:complete